MSSELLNLKQLSEFLGLSDSALRYHVRHGRIAPLRLGKRMLFHREEVLKQLKKGTPPHPVIDLKKGKGYVST